MGSAFPEARVQVLKEGGQGHAGGTGLCCPQGQKHRLSWWAEEGEKGENLSKFSELH